MSFLHRLYFSVGMLTFLLFSQSATANQKIPGEILLMHVQPQLTVLVERMGFLRGRPVDLVYKKKLVREGNGSIKFVEEWFDDRVLFYDEVFKEVVALEAKTNEAIAYYQDKKVVDMAFLKLIAEMDRSFKNLYAKGMAFLVSEFNAYYGGEDTRSYNWDENTVEGDAMLYSLRRSEMHLHALSDLFHTLQNDTEFVIKPRKKLYCFGCSHNDDRLEFTPGRSIELPVNLRYYDGEVLPETENDAATGAFYQARTTKLLSPSVKAAGKYHMDDYKIYDVNYWHEFFKFESLKAPGYKDAPARVEVGRERGEEEVVIERRRGRDVPPPPSTRGSVPPSLPRLEVDADDAPRVSRTPRAVIEDADRRTSTPAPKKKRKTDDDDDSSAKPPLPAGASGRSSSPTLEPDPVQ